MELTGAQYERIKSALLGQRGNVRLSNLQVLNAVLCGPNRAACGRTGVQMAWSTGAFWPLTHRLYEDESEAGVMDRVFERLQVEQIVRIKLEAVALNLTSIKVHPDGTGALKETDHSPSARAVAGGTPRFLWLPRMLERL
jgi:hypothetical protein